MTERLKELVSDIALFAAVALSLCIMGAAFVLVVDAIMSLLTGWPQ